MKENQFYEILKICWNATFYLKINFITFSELIEFSKLLFREFENENQYCTAKKCILFGKFYIFLIFAVGIKML